MSRAQLEKFIGTVSNNPAILQTASQSADAEKQAEQFIANVVQYARQQGFDFTEDEAKSWLTEQGKQSTEGQLTDTQLEAVAGGKGGDMLSQVSSALVSGLDAATGGTISGTAKSLAGVANELRGAIGTIGSATHGTGTFGKGMSGAHFNSHRRRG